MSSSLVAPSASHFEAYGGAQLEAKRRKRLSSGKALNQTINNNGADNKLIEGSTSKGESRKE